MEATYDPDCPHCDGKLHVITFTVQTSIPLTEDGFSLADAEFCDTEEEMTECDTCKNVETLFEAML